MCERVLKIWGMVFAKQHIDQILVQESNYFLCRAYANPAWSHNTSGIGAGTRALNTHLYSGWIPSIFGMRIALSICLVHAFFVRIPQYRCVHSYFKIVQVFHN